jgi:hypothetical protein
MDTTVKLSLENFCRPDIKVGKKGTLLLQTLRERALQMNDVVTETWHLIQLYIRYCFENDAQNHGLTMPKWDGKRVMQFLYVVTRTSERPSHAKLDDELVRIRKELYDPLRAHLPDDQKLVSRSGLPADALREACNRMASAIVVNITQHWYPRQWQYIALRDNLTKKEAKAKQQRINTAAGAGPTIDDSLPHELLTSVESDLTTYPERFLYTMWRMNKVRETNGKRLFAVLPMAHGFVPGACLHIDTNSLCDIVGERHELLTEYNQLHKERMATEKLDGKKGRPRGRDTRKEQMDEKDLVWSAFFDLKRAIRKPNAYKRFAHHITTDGASVSVGVAHCPNVFGT